jgi:hypothetical protein
MTRTLARGSGRLSRLPAEPDEGHREGSLAKPAAAQYSVSVSAGGLRPRRCMSLLVLYQCTHPLVIFSTSLTVSSGPQRNG